MKLDVETDLARLQPGLKIKNETWPLCIEGPFTVYSSEGAVDQFEVRILLDSRFPEVEPTIFEIGDRIPKTADRHINSVPPDSCCVTVWESWLATSPDCSFAGYLKGPLQEYFLNQFFFERTGKWRLGERSHGLAGVVEAFADALGVPPDQRVVLNYLRSLIGKPKGHLPCPCGSGMILRKCHRDQLHKLYARLPNPLLKRMLGRLISQGLA